MISKNNGDIINADYGAGEVVLIDKPLRKTSFHVVHKIRRATGIKKVGHAGTLDPLATGLLIVCTGKKTKEIESYQGMTKTYTGSFILGKTTESMDSETAVIEERSIEHVNLERLLEARDSFVGRIEQIPPMYSALKFKGKSLYKYARKGIDIKRVPREVVVSGFEITSVSLPEVFFEITCSKGTYIRVIADDFGKKLGCGAYLASLRRTKIGAYCVEEALTLDEFEKNFVLVKE